MKIVNINKKSLKNKLVNIVASHPMIVTFGIGLAITFVVGTAIGMIDHNQVFAAATATNTNNGGNAAAFAHIHHR